LQIRPIGLRKISCCFCNFQTY